MELDVIHSLLDKRPTWLAPFPVVVCIEYEIEVPPGLTGRGDLLLCNEDRSRFLAVEIKRHERHNRFLVKQMHRYRAAVKQKNPCVRVDGAAVVGDQLLQYISDEGFRPYVHKPRRRCKPLRATWNEALCSTRMMVRSG